MLLPPCLLLIHQHQRLLRQLRRLLIRRPLPPAPTPYSSEVIKTVSSDSLRGLVCIAQPRDWDAAYREWSEKKKLPSEVFKQFNDVKDVDKDNVCRNYGVKLSEDWRQHTWWFAGKYDTGEKSCDCIIKNIFTGDCALKICIPKYGNLYSVFCTKVQDYGCIPSYIGCDFPVPEKYNIVNKLATYSTYSCSNPIEIKGGSPEILIYNGNADTNIDIAFVGDNYPDQQTLKKDVEFILDYNGVNRGFFSEEPIKSNKNKFNRVKSNYSDLKCCFNSINKRFS